jgi:hypothetical protein
MKSHIAAIERPRCPNHRERMVLVREVPGRSGFEVRTFECAKCGQDKVVETKDPLNEAGGWLTARDLQSPE